MSKRRPHAPGKKNQQSPRPQKNTEDKAVEAPRQSFVIPPSPRNTKNSKEGQDATKPWWMSMRWKTVLEVIGILAGIGYAIVTYYTLQAIKEGNKINLESLLT